MLDLGLLRTFANYSGINKMIEKILQIRTAMRFLLEVTVFRSRSCARQSVEQELFGRMSGPCSLYPGAPCQVKRLCCEVGLLLDHRPAGV